MPVPAQVRGLLRRPPALALQGKEAPVLGLRGGDVEARPRSHPGLHGAAAAHRCPQRPPGCARARVGAHAGGEAAARPAHR
eukprot:13945988-Alexandrium_andersonii.AAC.1